MTFVSATNGSNSSGKAQRTPSGHSTSPRPSAATQRRRSCARPLVRTTHSLPRPLLNSYSQHPTDGFLLRIQKYKTDLDGADSSFTAKDHLAYLEDTILPLFRASPSLIVDHRLIKLPQSIIDEANAVLASLDEKRKAHDDEGKDAGARKHPHLPLRGRKFTGSRVGPAGTHMLTENFRPRNPRERFAEIKPKWLAQSPTAPKGANTCRNCAVSAQRFANAPEGKKPAKSEPEKYGCPLHLVSGREEDDWKALAERIFRMSTADGSAQDPRHAHFLYWVVSQHHVLRHLRALQAKFGHSDTFLTTTEEKPDNDLLLAMTLRDCSLFFRYEMLDDGGADSRLKVKLLDFKLADLDRKTPSKIPSWQETESGLIEGGWYEGKKDMPYCLLRRAALDDGSVDETKLKDEQALGAVYEEE